MKKNAVCIFFTEVRDLNLVWRRSRIIASSYSSNKARFYGFKITISTLQTFCLVVWVLLLFSDHSGKMSKLSFRARALDATKPMPIYRSEEIPDLPDFAAINRAVPQMPTGMEKEEECEHHLQRAISAQQAFGHTGELVIPTPEVYTIPEEEYELIYPGTYKATRQLIHMQPFAMDQDKPDYDMDSEDEKWINQQARKMEITQIQFEEVMDRLEKSSGQQVVTLKEAKLLLKQDDDLIIAVYDYWLNKRLKTQRPLIPTVKTEKRDGSTNNNPYVAFRRRTEKMQTRKNRKNDEASYEKMLKVRRDLSRAVTLLEMVKRREKAKREHLHLTIEVFEKRFQAGDFSGQILAEVSALKHTRTNFISVNSTCSQVIKQEGRVTKHKEESAPRKKREYTKRKNKQESLVVQPTVSQRVETDTGLSDLLSSDDEALSLATSPSEPEDENDPDGVFAFRRKKFCNYQAVHPLGSRQGNWPWCSPEEGGAGDRRYRYCLTSLRLPKPNCIGFARRRIGRGGRILLDRAWTPLDDYWSDLDHYLNNSLPNGLPPSNEFLTEIKNEWIHFRPQAPNQDECSVGDDLLAADEIPDDGVPSVDFSVVGVSGELGDIEPSLTTTAELLSQSEASNSEFNLQSYQSHQEELFEMQRKQLERLKEEEDQTQEALCRVAEHSFASQPTSRFTLDSASVQFAVSAVRSTSQVSGFMNKIAVSEPANHHSISTSSTTNTTSIKLERTLGLMNGPTAATGAGVAATASVETAVVRGEASSVASQAPSIVISSDSVLEMALADRVQGASSAVSHVHMAPSTETSESLPDFITFKGVPHELRLSGIERNGSDKQSSSQVNFSLTSVKLEPVSTDCGFPMDVT